MIDRSMLNCSMLRDLCFANCLTICDLPSGKRSAVFGHGVAVPNSHYLLKNVQRLFKLASIPILWNYELTEERVAEFQREAQNRIAAA